MRPGSIIALAGLIGGCATAGSDPRPAMCDWIVPYPRELQRAAADELSALPPHAALVRLIDDYGALRARIRAACGHGP